MAKRFKVRKGEYYEPHPDDPKALTVECPACHAAIGAWCGGIGDVHAEREDAIPSSKRMPRRRSS
jgi:hypothetical protein